MDSLDRIFIVDTENNRLVACEQQGNCGVFGNFGSLLGQFDGPRGLVLGAQDRVWVADTDNNRIAIYAVDGAKGKLVGELRGRFRRPEGVAVHPNGRIYATGAGSGNIEAFENGQSVAARWRILRAEQGSAVVSRRAP